MIYFFKIITHLGCSLCQKTKNLQQFLARTKAKAPIALTVWGVSNKHFKMKNLKKLSRLELKKIDGAGFTWDWENGGYTYTLDCDTSPGSLVLCPNQQAVKCIQIEPGNAIGCNPGQNCINGACVGGFTK